MKDTYGHIRAGGMGVYESTRGLIEVWGKEAVQFLNGLITNDAAALGDGMHMLAAFPNAQGRLIAVVRVLRRGEKFLFECEGATRETVFQNLFRFTFAGDFFVADLSENYQCFRLLNDRGLLAAEGSITFFEGPFSDIFVPAAVAADFREKAAVEGSVFVDDDLYEVLRIESGIPRHGVDIDETTIVPEIGREGMISYQKGCYIGQEIIARIHFRGHVAKMLTGLALPQNSEAMPGAELKSVDGKNAGRVTSVTYSPALKHDIALGFVRFDHLADGTELVLDGATARVKNLPFL